MVPLTVLGGPTGAVVRLMWYFGISQPPIKPPMITGDLPGPAGRARPPPDLTVLWLGGDGSGEKPLKLRPLVAGGGGEMWWWRVAWTKTPKLLVGVSLLVANAVFIPTECCPKNTELMKRNWPGAAHI